MGIFLRGVVEIMINKNITITTKYSIQGLGGGGGNTDSGTDSGTHSGTDSGRALPYRFCC